MIFALRIIIIIIIKNFNSIIFINNINKKLYNINKKLILLKNY